MFLQYKYSSKTGRNTKLFVILIAEALLLSAEQLGLHTCLGPHVTHVQAVSYGRAAYCFVLFCFALLLFIPNDCVRKVTTNSFADAITGG